MGCLLGCFGRRKNRLRQKRRESFQPRSNRISEVSTKDFDRVNLRVSTVEQVTKSPHDDHLDFSRVAKIEQVPKIYVIPTTDISDKPEERNSPSSTRKKVTFDSNVKTYEHIVVEESIELFEENKEEVIKPLKSRQAPCSSERSDVTSNSSGSFPSNHRYQNCRESDDEEEDVTDCDESDIDDYDDDDDGGLLHENYYNDDENYGDKQVYTEEIADNAMEIEKIEEKNGARDRSAYVNAVLNPIENLTQWNAVKSKGRTAQTQTRKEKATNLKSDQEHKLNASFSLEEPPRVSFSIKPRSRDKTKKQTSQEVAVDASLSTWLSTSQTTNSGCSSSVETAISEKKKYTSKCSKPAQSYDERPILGGLTSEEIKQFSVRNSPRKSPSRSPESPIIGTVGGYWNHHSMTTSMHIEKVLH